jgi:hypothetical protein
MVNIRAKGQNGEREFLTKLSELIGLEEKLTRNLSQTRGGGEDCNQLPGYSIEIKNQKTVSISTWWEQAIKQAKTSKATPLLAYKVPRKGWLVVIPFSWIYGAGEVYPPILDTVQISLENFAKLYLRIES